MNFFIILFFVVFIILNFSYFFFYFFQVENIFISKVFSAYRRRYKIVNIQETYCSIKWVIQNKINSFQNSLFDTEQKMIYFFTHKVATFFKKYAIIFTKTDQYNPIKINFFQYSLKYTNDFYYNDYKILFILFIVSFSLSSIIFILSNIIGNSTTLYFERAKLSVYECGFQPFERIDKCQIFIFYRLAIFFIIFEAELIFLYPWTINICELSFYSIEYFYNAFFFIFILFFGFFYEIKNKALDF